MEASFFMLRLHFCLMYYRSTEMVIGQTIAVPLLSPPEQYCCRQARHWRQGGQAGTIGKSRMRARMRANALIGIARFV
jgi:hypothetical protein